MTTIDRPNRRLLDRGIEVFRDAMRVFLIGNLEGVRSLTAAEAVVSALEQRGRARRAEEIQRRLSGEASINSLIDTSDFQLLISFYWDDVFKSRFTNRDIQTDCQHVHNVRNPLSHPSDQDMGTEEVRAALFHIKQALIQIGFTTEQQEIQDLMDSLVNPKVEELAAEVGRLSLQMNEQHAVVESLENELDRAINVLDHASNAFQDALDALAENLQEILSKITNQQDEMEVNMESIGIALDKHDHFASQFHYRINQLEERFSSQDTGRSETGAREQGENELHPCACGCGTQVSRLFAQGHDSKLRSYINQVHDGKLDVSEISQDAWDRLSPCDICGMPNVHGHRHGPDPRLVQERDEALLRNEAESELGVSAEIAGEQDEDEDDSWAIDGERVILIGEREVIETLWVNDYGEERMEYDPPLAGFDLLIAQGLRRRTLNIMPTALFYCLVENCRFSDGTRKSWYNEYKAREHEEMTGHEVRELER